MSDDIESSGLRRLNQRGAELRSRDDAARAGVAQAGPAGRNEPTREPPGRQESEGMALTRRSRLDRDTNLFVVPDAAKRSGYDYQWITTRILGEPVDGSVLAAYHEQGWRPVTGTTHPDLALPGGNPADPIVRHGQMLMTRPMHLTMEAKQEDYAVAEEQKRARLEAAAGGRMGDDSLARVPGVVPRQLQVEIQGEVGTHVPR